MQARPALAIGRKHVRQEKQGGRGREWTRVMWVRVPGSCTRVENAETRIAESVEKAATIYGTNGPLQTSRPRRTMHRSTPEPRGARGTQHDLTRSTPQPQRSA